jgi:aryl-alcohol dehydrogenase-like predicted oxidoreductase
MKKVSIKNTDLSVSPINFGGNVFGWTLDEKKSFEILDAFVAGGFNFIDTANTYPWWFNGVGELSEEIIGKWMKARGNRNDLVIATKVGSENKNHPIDSSKKHILQSIDESLARLQVDHLDLYYTHFDDGKTPVEETLEAYDQIIKAGKVRYIAASNLTPERLVESLELSKKNGLPKYVALQPHYNLLERANYEEKYRDIVEKNDLSVFTYFSLAAGFLTGKYRKTEDMAGSAREGMVKPYMNDKGLGVLAALDKVSEKHGSSPAVVSLAWLLAQPDITAPIVSATSERQLETIFKAPELTLDKEDLEILDKASK